MKTRDQIGFTLVEVIATIAVISVVTVAMVLPMIRRLDRIAGEKESAALKTIAKAFKERATITRVIPNESGWATAAGGQLGLALNNVTNNDRGLRRIFLIDPGLAIGNNSSAALSYTQTVSGHTMTNISGFVLPPISPRLMLVSSISASLPTNLVSGVAASSGPYSFNNIWSTAEGAIPAGWSWGGRGDDLKVQRINLSDLFVEVILNNRDNTSNLIPSYAINELAATTVPYGALLPRYFLKGTELKLFNAINALEYSEVLYNSQSFTYEFGTWQGEVFLANGVGQTSPADLQKAMNLFMASSLNTSAKSGANQTGVSNAMVSYMTAFVAWRDGGYLSGTKAQPCPGNVQAKSGTASGNVAAAQNAFDNNNVSFNLITR